MPPSELKILFENVYIYVSAIYTDNLHVAATTKNNTWTIRQYWWMEQKLWKLGKVNHIYPTVALLSVRMIINSM